MRFSLVITAFLLSVVASLAYAAPIVVRSGAHEGFSRLVLDVSPDTDWAVQNNGSSARITIASHDDGFDINRVFDRIDRTHIEKLDTGPNSLDVHFSCACALSSFRQGNTMIVLDIAPSRDAAVATARPASQIQPSETEALPWQFGRDAVFDTRSETNTLPPAWTGAFARKPNDLGDGLVSDIPEPNAAESTSLADAQRSISRQVGAAATRGLLSPKANHIALPLIQNRPQIDTEIFDSSTVRPASDQLDIALSRGNLRITSSSDIPINSDLTGSSTTLGARCIDPSVTAIGEWATEQPFSTQIAALRNGLFSEFDRLDPNAAVQLARAYLHFGFGVEVKEVLALDPSLTADNPALIEMAEIMEYGHARQAKYLQNFVECDTDVALWAILSKPSIAPATSINTSAALRAVTALPMHLRSFIAPELSRRFLSYGAQDAAAAALRSLERATQSLPSAADLAKADLEMADGNVSDAQDRLARVVSSNGEQSAEALIKFVESHLEAEGQIEPDVATLVEAYALQMRDDPIGAELQKTHVLALGKSGQFNAAFEALGRIKARDADETDPPVAAALLKLLTRNGTDIEFLDLTFRQFPKLSRISDPETVLRVADRLSELGFALEAERLLAQHVGIPDDANTRFVRAKIALALSRPFEAEALIFGLQSTEAETLRATAKAQTGAYDEAHELFAELDQDEQRRQTAWLSNGWVSLVGDDTPVFSDVARLAQTEISNDANPDGMLRRASEAISESQAARSVIEELLRASVAEAQTDP